MPYDHPLTDDEKRELLRIARASLKEFLISGRVPPGAPHRASMIAPAATFVTLKRGETLRGCIGTMQDDTPLYKSIQEMAIAAARRDPRFKPVSLEELPEIVIEVSVLGGRHRVATTDEVEVGKHGLCITAEGRRGLLLPQVALEHGYDARAFLAKVCEKAELPPDAWTKPDAVVEVFDAQVFDEKKHPPASGVTMFKR